MVCLESVLNYHDDIVLLNCIFNRTLNFKKTRKNVLPLPIFQVLMAASMKMEAFWDIVLCSLGVNRHSEVCTASIIRVMMEAVCTCETLVYSETMWQYIPEGPHLQGKTLSFKLYLWNLLC
jgi:hypothetical protein